MKTEDGAIAFAKFFITSVDRAYVSQDSTEVDALSAPECGGCTGVIKVINGMAASNEKQARPAVSIAGAQFVPIGGKDIVDVFASYAAVERLRNGKVIFAGRAEKTAYRLGLTWSAAGWQVASTDVLEG